MSGGLAKVAWPARDGAWEIEGMYARQLCGALLASLLALGCDPPGVRPEDEAKRGSEAQVLGVASLQHAKVLAHRTGMIEVYDRHGDLRVQIVDPEAKFVTTLGPVAGAGEWSKPHPWVTIRLAGLSDWVGRHSQGHPEVTSWSAAIQEAESTEGRLAALEDELAALWAEKRPAAERRRVLFARWDECEEAAGGPAVARVERVAEAVEAIRKQAGERAREVIEKFVRTHLPAGSGDAFGAEELAALNQGRASRRSFAPYARR